MIHTINDTFKKILYNPIVLVLLMPASYLMIGTIYASQYTALNWSGFLLLYALLLTNYYIENYFSKHQLFSKQVVTPKILMLELINVIIIATLSFSSNYLVAILIILYSLIIHFQHTLKLFNLPVISIAILSFFKGGILTYLSFFIQIHFVPLELFKWSIPLILLNLSVEVGNYFIHPISDQQLKNRSSLIILLVALTYISSILFLYTSFQYLLWLFVLTIPFVIRFLKLFLPNEEKRSKRSCLKTISIFQIIYLLTFSLIESLYLYWF